MDDDDFEDLIEHVRKQRGFDFRGYKRASLRRRIDKRMFDVGIADLVTYRSYIEAHPPEYEQLLNTILINVTSFFRDAPAWKVLRTRVLPEVVARKKPEEPIRVWSAGCATGEEPYSVAMLLAEALGASGYRRRVRIYATDLDEDALETARRAKFDLKGTETVPKKLHDKYFEMSGSVSVFRRDFRKSVIFGRHDIVNDAPISNIDLLLCRNVMIYLDSQTQNRLLPLLHFALAEAGVLFLGKAETLLVRSPLFMTIDIKSRIFSKLPRNPGQEDMLASAAGARSTGPLEAPDLTETMGAIIDQSSIGYLVINPRGYLVLANRAARRLFDLGEEDIGRPFDDLEVSYNPIELRHHIKKAIKSEKSVRLDGVDVDDNERRKNGRNFPHLSIEIMAMRTSDSRHYATTLIFYDTTLEHQLRAELQATNEAMEVTNEELEATNEELEATNEELETTNEELETTNEELQSTNEELEATNEELQSTNEELEATNEELHVRGEELDNYRAIIDESLDNINIAIIVVDANYRVMEWNQRCQILWGLSKTDTVGRSVLDLDFGVSLGSLKRPLKQISSGKQQRFSVTIPGIDQRGRAIIYDVKISPLKLKLGAIGGAVILLSTDGTDRTSPEMGSPPDKIGTRPALRKKKGK